MSDFLDLRRDDPYAASYPASITGGGGAPAAVWGTASGDISATFQSVTGVDPASIADRPTLLVDATVGTAAMTALYDHDPFPTDAYIMLGDGDWVSWDGLPNGWIDGPTPPPPPAPTPTSAWSKSQIVEWLNEHGDPAQDALTKAELLEHVANILDAEVDG